MRPTPIDERLAALAAWVHHHRGRILKAWAATVAADPEVETANGLSVRQLENHVPGVVDGFVACLRGGTDAAESAIRRYGSRGATHGQHRWRQGYLLTEVVREWGHLQLCLQEELEQYAATCPATDAASADALRLARRVLVRLCSQAVQESTARYYHLRQAEAAASLRDLQRATESVRPLDRGQAELLRGAAHDLRGNLGIVLASVSVLAHENLPREDRRELVEMVKRSVGSQQKLLDNLIALTRLQAGQERREVDRFDAGRLLDELCGSCRSIAEARGLSLVAEGPRPLWVQGDPVRVRRIAQNLLLNALEYTDTGRVEVTWASCEPDPPRWVLTVADSGPGLGQGGAAAFAEALEPVALGGEGVRSDRPTGGRRGEGIGLAIVKRLCELLEATLEVEDRPGGGTVFRVILPRRYAELDSSEDGPAGAGASSS